METRSRLSWLAVALVTVLSLSPVSQTVAQTQQPAQPQPPQPPTIAAPNRRPDEGKGPYKTFVIRGATLIDGTPA